jgi:hypothetical protein
MAARDGEHGGDTSDDDGAAAGVVLAIAEGSEHVLLL